MEIQSKVLKVRIVGSTLGVTIPKSFSEALDIERGDYVVMFIKDGWIMIRKVRDKEGEE